MYTYYSSGPGAWFHKVSLLNPGLPESATTSTCPAGYQAAVSGLEGVEVLSAAMSGPAGRRSSSGRGGADRDRPGSTRRTATRRRAATC